MESLLAIGVGLVLRIVVDIATDNDDRVGGVLVGLWEGVVLNHFVRRMPRSFDPYLGFGFRIFVDFLFTQSLSRLALVALWALVGMLLADITPNVWRDSGLRHLYRQVRKDVRHVKRSVPHIRIKNDLPSVRLFSKSRSTSSVRSDRAAPSRSSAPSPAPTPGPARRPGRSPPGTFPDVSGWSETGTDVSNPRERVVRSPGPSPALMPSREHTAYEHIDTIRVATSQTRTTTIQDTTFTVTQTQHESTTTAEAVVLGNTAASTSFGPLDDPSRHDPPVIPDDWVNINHPTPAQSNEPVVPFQADPDSTPEPQTGPSTPTQSRPVSILVPPPAIDVLPDIPDIDHGNRTSQPPEQVPLPESRAASVIGGVFDQPHPRSALRDGLRSRLDKATSDIGIDPAKSLAPIAETQSVRTQSTTRSWSSWARSKLRQSVDLDTPEPPPKETQQNEPVDQSKPGVVSAAQESEYQIPTPAQVNPPLSVLTQPRDAPPLLLTPEPEQVEQQEQTKKGEIDEALVSAGVDSSPALLQGGADKGDTAGLSGTSLLDLSPPTCTPPPPFTEFAGVEDIAAGEGATEDLVTQDEPPTELTKEQKAAEDKRIAFLLTQAQELEGSRTGLQQKLDKEDDPTGSPANAIESDLDDTDNTLGAIKARMVKKWFSEPPLDPPVLEVALVANKSIGEIQLAITSAVLDVLLTRDDAGPMTIQVVINKQKTLKGKAKDARDTVVNFAKRHRFATRSEPATPGIINITF